MTKSLKAWRKSQKPIVFRSKRYGTVKLHSFIRVKDVIFLLDYLEEKNDVNSREFTVQFLNEFTLKPPQESFSTWDDKSLLLLVNKWSRIAIKDEVADGINDFDDFKSKVLNHEKRTSKNLIEAMRGASQVAANQLRDITKIAIPGIVQAAMSLSSNMTSIVSSSLKAFDTARLIQTSLIPKLPDLKEIFAFVEQSVKETNEIVALLEQLGYDHAADMLEDRFARELLKVKPDKRQAIITKKLMSRTTGYEFSNELERLFSIPQIHGRWTAIKQALIAHQTHQYFLATPVFLAQAEGIFTELLILRNLAYKEKTRVFASEDGKPMDSLSKKINRAKGHFDDEKIIRTTVDVLVGRFVNRRNDILHGRISNYGTAKNSTQTLLLVFTLAGVLENDLKNISKK